MRIEKLNAEGLKDFLGSDEYRDMSHLPVSSHRALSWLNNPRLKPEDIILYLGYEEKKLIAYRSILPDRHEEIRFGWLSGNWVLPEKRRLGFASMLFEEAFADWGHQLMYTNYAPESKAVYDKSGTFDLYRESQGMRYYQRSSMAELLGNRAAIYRRTRPLLRLTDGMLNIVQDARIRMGSNPAKDIKVEENKSFDLESIDFLQKSGGTGFCKRELEEFDWISSFPWIIAGKEKDQRYYFSSVSSRFWNICLKIRDKEAKLNGVIWIVVNGDKMSLPYLAFDPSAGEDISLVLAYYMRQYKVAYLTTFQSDLVDVFRAGPILTRRKMTQNYFATRELLKQLPDQAGIRFQDGEGDVAFV